MTDNQNQQQNQNQDGQGDGDKGANKDGEKPIWDALPDNMRGTTAEETLQKIIPSWKGYHEEWTKRGPVPKTPEEYTFTPVDEKLKPAFANANDPAIKIFRQAAFEAGLPQKQYEMVLEKTFSKLAAEKLLGPQLDPVADYKVKAELLGHKELNDDAKKALETAETEMLAWAENTAKQMKLSERAQTELESLVLTPGGFELLRAMQGQQGKSGARVGGESGDKGGLGEAEVLAMLNDERANPMSPKFDKAFQDKAEAASEEIRQKRAASR